MPEILSELFISPSGDGKLRSLARRTEAVARTRQLESVYRDDERKVLAFLRTAISDERVLWNNN
jgi:hypothetical protein